MPAPAGPGRRGRLDECAVTRARGREEAAHRYADAGWHVFPCEPGGKRPATEHGFLDATTDHKRIERWWRAEPRSNLAIATGAPGPDVVDVDRHKDGNGFSAWNKLKQAGLTGQPMAYVRTPSGGFHAYYKGTCAAERPPPRRSRRLPGSGRLRGGQPVAGSPAATTRWPASRPAATRSTGTPPASCWPRSRNGSRTGRRSEPGQASGPDYTCMANWSPVRHQTAGTAMRPCSGRRAGWLRRVTRTPSASSPTRPGPPGWMTAKSAGRSPRRSRPPGVRQAVLLSIRLRVSPRRPRSRTCRPRPRQAPYGPGPQAAPSWRATA